MRFMEEKRIRLEPYLSSEVSGSESELSDGEEPAPVRVLHPLLYLTSNLFTNPTPTPTITPTLIPTSATPINYPYRYPYSSYHF